jgi:4-amino-4-deoxy-L-arabinose transferase-like glycosyltransferase
MTSLAGRRPVAIAQRIVVAWTAIGTRWHPVAVIVIAWTVLALPLVFFRGYNSDEGLAVSIARTAVEDGEWLVPNMFNVRAIERPTLLSWIIAAISEPFGHVSQIAARLPIALFLLVGCLLIYFLLRKVGAGVVAALFGAALFLACPLVMRAYVMITADLPLAVLLFLAFVLWWDGAAKGSIKGSIGLSRWIAIGVVLALAGLLKGPQPIAYFALGVGVFVLGSRSWRQLPGLVLAGLICAVPLALWYAAIYRPGDEGIWAAFMRVRPNLIFSGPLQASVRLWSETLPAALAAAVYLIARWFNGRDRAPAGFVAALACYAFIAPIFILFWPGGSAPRYYFPMVPALCVFGGLAYDMLAARRPQIVAPLLLLTAGLLIYALGYAVASPLLPMRFRPTQIEAARITQLVQAAPGPIYRTGDTALNLLPYVPGRILNATLEQLGTVPGPAWMVLPADEAAALLARRPDKLHAVMPLGEVQQWRLLRLDP